MVCVTIMPSSAPAVRARKGIFHFSGCWKRNKQGVKVPTDVSPFWADWVTTRIIWQTESVSILISSVMFWTGFLLSVQQIVDGFTLPGSVGNDGKYDIWIKLCRRWQNQALFCLSGRGQGLASISPDGLICKSVHRDLDDLGRRALLSTILDRNVCDKDIRKWELRWRCSETSQNRLKKMPTWSWILPVHSDLQD